jgi:hypothetical protein
VLSIIIIDIFSYRTNNLKNGFIRLFPPHLLLPLKFLDIKYNSYYIAGAKLNKIYLANSTAPSRLLIFNNDLSDTQHLHLNIKGNPRLIQGSNIIVIDSSSIYVMEGRVSTIMHGTLSNLNIDTIQKSYSFNLAIPISHSSVIIRTYNDDNTKNILAKISLNESKIIKAPNILEAQTDGIFSTDGMLLYEPISKHLIYIYYYRNQITCLDTNLKMIYISKTIDTVSYAKIKVGKYTSEGIVTLASPPSFVNVNSCVNDKYIFVHSALMANNEEKETFNRYSVIDVYSLYKGEYRFSFYLPDLRNIKINNFRVFGKTLVAMYDHYIYIYQLNF